MNELTQEELDKFTDVMIKKAAHGHGWVDGRFYWRPGDEAEALRGLIQNVIIDTELLMTGRVPLERWLGND
jgi:hypothetical protein